MAWEQQTADDGSPVLVDGKDSIGVDPDGDVVITLQQGGRTVWSYLPLEMLEAFVREERARRARLGPPRATPTPSGDQD